MDKKGLLYFSLPKFFTCKDKNLRKVACPLFLSPFYSGSPENIEAFFNILKERVPLGRMGQPSEIAAVVAFMASEGASFMNGADIQIDGGEAQI